MTNRIDVDKTINMLSIDDRKELNRLLMADEIEEWKRTFQPIKKHRAIIKAIHFHVIGQEVFCSIESLP